MKTVIQKALSPGGGGSGNCFLNTEIEGLSMTSSKSVVNIPLLVNAILKHLPVFHRIKYKKIF